MPIYEFECEACGTVFEELIEAGAEPPGCPECGSGKTRRVYTAPAYTKGPTANQRRRMEDRRGTDRGGALERFKQERKREGSGRGER